MQQKDFKEEIYKTFWPKIEYLIENRNNKNKFNSNMDIACDSLRALEAIEAQVQSLIRDFKTCKKLILNNNANNKECEK